MGRGSSRHSVYVAPNCFEGQPRTKRSEIYSLGLPALPFVDAYPVEGKTRAELERAHGTVSATATRPKSQTTWSTRSSGRRNPQERYATVGAFEAALARFADARPRHSPCRGPTDSAGGRGPRRRGPGGVGWETDRPLRRQPPAAVTASTPGLGAPRRRATAAEYHAVAFERTNGGFARATVALGLDLSSSVKLRVSTPTYVYIVNEDDQGGPLLFPQPGPDDCQPVSKDPPPRTGNAETLAGVECGTRAFLNLPAPRGCRPWRYVFPALPRPKARTPRSQQLPRRFRLRRGRAPPSGPRKNGEAGAFSRRLSATPRNSTRTVGYVNSRSDNQVASLMGVLNADGPARQPAI